MIDLNVLNYLIQTNLSTMMLHQKFKQFKCCNIDRDVVIVACGPTAKEYVPMKDAVHIGVNRSFQINPEIEMDYIFLQDYSGKTPEYIDELNAYRYGKCQKFYGLTREWEYDVNRTIPESHAIKANAIRYRSDWMPFDGYKPRFAYDLTTQALGCFYTIVFPALQFALWTYPNRIYLVGCDCTEDGYAYSNEKNVLNVGPIIQYYADFKEFAHKYYPDIQITCIRPVGLKGIFPSLN